MCEGDDIVGRGMGCEGVVGDEECTNVAVVEGDGE